MAFYNCHKFENALKKKVLFYCVQNFGFHRWALKDVIATYPDYNTKIIKYMKVVNDLSHLK